MGSRGGDRPATGDRPPSGKRVLVARASTGGGRALPMGGLAVLGSLAAAAACGLPPAPGSRPAAGVASSGRAGRDRSPGRAGRDRRARRQGHRLGRNTRAGDSHGYRSGTLVGIGGLAASAGGAEAGGHRGGHRGDVRKRRRRAGPCCFESGRRHPWQTPGTVRSRRGSSARGLGGGGSGRPNCRRSALRGSLARGETACRRCPRRSLRLLPGRTSSHMGGRGARGRACPARRSAMPVGECLPDT